MSSKGITLVELAVVMGIIVIATAIAGPAIYDTLSPESRLKERQNSLYSDILFAQNEAVRQGAFNLTLDAGTGGSTLRQRKVFFVFEPPSSYSIWRWEDSDGDNQKEADEFNPDLAGAADADAPVREVEMDDSGKFVYGLPDYNPYKKQCTGQPNINRIACGDDPGTPTVDITFTQGTLPITPCNSANGPCRYIEFDSNGFTGWSGTVYITNNKYAYAISGNGAGVFDMCMWRYDPNTTETEKCHWVPMH